MENPFDVSALPLEKLVAFVVQHKQRAWILRTQSDEQVQAWARKKTRKFLVNLCAGWGRTSLDLTNVCLQC